MRDFSRVWRVWRGVLLQMWGTFRAFGEFGVVFCSKRERLFACLEGLAWRFAPNVSDFSRVWSVAVSLHVSTKISPYFCNFFYRFSLSGSVNINMVSK